jgi:2-methylcitrate dehydratase PrpD
MVKEGIPWAAFSGVSAALLTRSGFTGPHEILDHLPIYQPQKLLEGFGKEFLILKTYFKRYPCCRWLHPIIDGCLTFMEEKRFDLSQLQKIHIQTFSRAMGLPNRVRPQTLEEAQFSISFCSALAMVKKEAGFRHILPEDLNNPKILLLSEKVRIELNSEFDKTFPEKIFSKILFETSEGKYEKVVSSVQGDPDQPFSASELQEKYLAYARPVLGEDNAESLLAMIKHLENNSIKDLVKVISLGLLKNS